MRRFQPFLILIALCACSTASPNRMIREIGDEFLAAYNRGSVEELTLFFTRHATAGREDEAPGRARWVHSFVWQPIRTFRVHSHTERSPREIEFLGHSEVTEAWYRFSLEIDAETGGVSFGFESAVPPAVRQAPLTAAEAALEMRQYLERVCGADVFSGAVLVARDGAPVLTHACGRADHETASANTTDTLFNLGSATKMFTGVAVMRQVMEGKLRLDDNPGRHLPTFGSAELRSSVTIEQLLTHTSGMGNFFTEEYRQRKRQIKEVGDLAPFIESQPLEFPPGARFGYSNAGYVLLGLILEAVTGSDYYAFVETAVFEPAGMPRSTWVIADADTPRRATGYTFMTEGGDFSPSRVPNDFVHPMRGSPAGSSYSTVKELLAFDRALREHVLLPAAATDALWQPRVTTDRNTGYGYGFETRDTGAGRVVGHNGHHYGISAQFDMYLDSGWTVVVLSNYDPPAAPVVAEKFRRLLERVSPVRGTSIRP